MTYDCMTPDELALWTEAARAAPRMTTPCYDCPLWFHLQEKAAGRCDRRPVQTGRPPLTEMETLAGRLLREYRAKRAAASRRYRAKLREQAMARRRAA